MDREDILLVYDGECPVCHAYCQLVNIRESMGSLRLINARESSRVTEEITALGLDIDQGMVLKVGGEFYYGADALHALALMGSRSGAFNRLNYWMFKSKAVSTFLYPVLRFFRNLLLKTLGKSKINNIKAEGNTKF
ncbi:putative DCC family thiol-disulfide oxidoreductase YuxK [Litorivivens lipolytica]|uniref:Putative DCC family thiol-disulfide oxidoreductase YuxK n=1 Tax=Litorivivens lipolytica TaxID=1524264 RepID=A0A7W4W711_9GAMM|nr:DCC1-like thiol-disulfide oxidoreductase family protein [Litorivivens lipolytica]MBB3048495.1 putative DCC family thiol-disulfide oxidoreductase YuxK [Litorivivens lipolytica]